MQPRLVENRRFSRHDGDVSGPRCGNTGACKSDSSIAAFRVWVDSAIGYAGAAVGLKSSRLQPIDSC